MSSSRPDAADRLSAALDHVVCRQDGAGAERSCFGFDTLRLGLRVRTGGTLANLIDIFGRRDAAGAEPTAWLDIVEGPDPVLEGCLPEASGGDERVVSAAQRHYGFWDPTYGGKLVYVDRLARRGFVWHRSPESLPSWETARPFLHAFKGLAPFTGLTPLHAAAVALGDGGLLIAGRGGAGKTSLALACVEAGWRYVADDFLLLRRSPSLRAVNLYRSARIRADMFEPLRRTMSASYALSTDSGEVKGEVDLGRLGACVIGDAEIGAIVVPRRGGAPRAALAPLRRSVVLRELAATTLAMLPGDGQATYDEIARSIEGVPCYAFDPGPTLAAAPAALAGLAAGTRVAAEA